jgi:DNA repair protein RecO (recombination protein O)
MRAIAIHTVQTNDRGGVVRLFTETHGQRAYYATLGKQAQLFQAVSLLEVEERNRKQTGMAALSEVRRAVVLGRIATEPARAAIALFMAEVLGQCLVEDQANEPLFDYVWHSVQALEVDHRVGLYPLLFMGRVLRFMGVAPSQALEEDQQFFDLRQGEWRIMPPTHGDWLGGTPARLLCACAVLSVDELDALATNRAQRNEVLHKLLRYIQLHLTNDRKVRSFTILAEVFA